MVSRELFVCFFNLILFLFEIKNYLQKQAQSQLVLKPFFEVSEMSHGGAGGQKVEKDPSNKIQRRIEKKSLHTILPYHVDGTHCQYQNLKRKAKKN